MRAADFSRLALGAVIAHRLRSFLTALGIAVGIAAVVLLTSLGEGLHQYVLGEFTQFGTNIIAVVPGKENTTGMSGAVISTVRPLSLEDAEALRRLPQVEALTPMVQGVGPVEFGKRTRNSLILGVGADLPQVWRMAPARGRFLPPDEPRAARAFAVLGAKCAGELFGRENPLGKRIRIGGERYRVIGVMEEKGQVLGFDMDDTVYIPVAKALSMFDREGLMEIDLLYAPEVDSKRIAKAASALLMDRHGREDFTLITQEEMLDTLSAVLNMLTLAVGALGGISLVVGGIGILTIMTISVNERTSEIGLLRAIGAGRAQILMLFLGEAVALAALGGLAGLALGAGGAALIGATVPALPTHTPWSYVIAAESVAAAIGLLAGVLPARRAANLDPIEALRAE